MLTVKDIRDEIERIALADPDHQYTYKGNESSCSYVKGDINDGGGCIVGRALMNLGISRDYLAECDKDGGFPAAKLISQLLHEGLISHSPGEYSHRSFVQNFQAFQDQGFPWGECLDKANARGYY